MESRNDLRAPKNPPSDNTPVLIGGNSYKTAIRANIKTIARS